MRICSKLYMPRGGNTFACRDCWSLSYESRQVRTAKFYRTIRNLTDVGRQQAKPTTTRVQWMKLEKKRLRLKGQLGPQASWPRPGMLRRDPGDSWDPGVESGTLSAQ